MFPCLCTQTDVYQHVCMYISMHLLLIYVCMHIQTLLCMYIHISSSIIASVYQYACRILINCSKWIYLSIYAISMTLTNEMKRYIRYHNLEFVICCYAHRCYQWCSWPNITKFMRIFVFYIFIYTYIYIYIYIYKSIYSTYLRMHTYVHAYV